MSLEWLPGVLAGALAGLLSIWKGNAIVRERVSSLRRDFEDSKKLQEHSEEVLASRLETVLAQLQETLTQQRIASTEMGTTLKLAARALDGVVTRIEAMDMRLFQAEKDVAVLRQQIQQTGSTK